MARLICFAKVAKRGRSKDGRPRKVLVVFVVSVVRLVATIPDYEFERE